MRPMETVRGMGVRYLLCPVMVRHFRRSPEAHRFRRYRRVVDQYFSSRLVESVST